MIKNIIFDMDGVLINDMKRHAWAWNKALKEHNIKIPKKDFFLTEGANHKEYLQRILTKNNIKISKKQQKQIHIRKINLFKQKGKTKSYNIQNQLQKLKQAKINLAVATGGNKILAKQAIKKHFPNSFQTIITGEDVLKSKPNPEAYKKALKRLCANPAQTIVIENAPYGITAAKKAKTKVYAIESTLNKKYLTKADKTFKNHKKLFKYLFQELNIK
jgi:beta-phosphoglucomutase